MDCQADVRLNGPVEMSPPFDSVDDAQQMSAGGSPCSCCMGVECVESGSVEPCDK